MSAATAINLNITTGIFSAGQPYHPEQDKSPFAPVPNWLSKRKEISPGAKLCYGRLRQYAGKTGEAFPKLSTLSDEIGMSESQTRRYLRELEKHSLIKSNRRGQGKSNTYDLLIHVWIYQKNSPAQDDSPAPVTSEHPSPVTGEHSLPYKENKTGKKKTTAAVVSFGDRKEQVDREIERLIDLLPADQQTGPEGQDNRRNIRKAVVTKGQDFTERNILYTNNRNEKNLIKSYPGYLAVCLKNDYGEAWAARTAEQKAAEAKAAEIQAAEAKAAEIQARQERQKAAADQEQMNRIRERFLSMPDSEKRDLENRFLDCPDIPQSEKPRFRKHMADFSRAANNRTFQGFLAEAWA